MDCEARHNSQLIGARRRIDRKISAAIRSPIEWFTNREIAQKGKTRIVHYAVRRNQFSTRRPTYIRRIHAHSAAKIRRQIRSLPLCFFVTRRLGIYCFNLPWLCLIMESSFWPARRQRAARPLKQTFLCLCFTEVKRCSANRLWIRTMLSLRRFRKTFPLMYYVIFYRAATQSYTLPKWTANTRFVFGASFTVEKSIWPSISWLRLNTSTTISIIRSQFRTWTSWLL